VHSVTQQLLTPRISPRSTFLDSPLPVPGMLPPASARRPLTSVPAYRRAGLDPQWSLLPSTTESIQKWRTLPKYEEQMMLGILKSQTDSLKNNKAVTSSLWKMKRFEQVAPRIL